MAYDTKYAKLDYSERESIASAVSNSRTGMAAWFAALFAGLGFILAFFLVAASGANVKHIKEIRTRMDQLEVQNTQLKEQLDRMESTLQTVENETIRDQGAPSRTASGSASEG